MPRFIHLSLQPIISRGIPRMWQGLCKPLPMNMTGLCRKVISIGIGTVVGHTTNQSSTRLLLLMIAGEALVWLIRNYIAQCDYSLYKQRDAIHAFYAVCLSSQLSPAHAALPMQSSPSAPRQSFVSSCSYSAPFITTERRVFQLSRWS
jgi:hypothetical protein